MNIQLTPHQQIVLDSEVGERARTIDPRTNAAYILVPEADYDSARELLVEDRLQRAIHAMALQNAVGRMDELS